MKIHRHAWILLLALGSAVAGEGPKEDPPAAPDSERRERGPRGPDRERGPKEGPGRDQDRKGADRMKQLWKAADTDGDGFISPAEFAAMERPGQLPEEKRNEIFARLDKNHDGRIGPDELRRKRHDGMPPLEKVDANKDGKIVFEEFQKLGFVARLPEERQREMFGRMDRNHDGALTPEDRPRGRKRDWNRDGKGGRGPHPMELVKSLDENGDGALSFEEFRKASFLKEKGEDEQEDKFEALDNNGDHKIDAADFPPRDGDKRKGPGGGE